MTTIAFTGDVAFSQYFAGSWREPPADEEILSFLGQADYGVVNVEGPLTDRPIRSRWRLNHASPLAAAGVLPAMGLNVWDLCNNHIMDCGTEAVADSVRAAESHGCIPLGVGRTGDERPGPVILDGGDCPVGIFTVTEDYRGNFTGRDWIVTVADEAYIRDQLRALRRRAERVVLVAHGGREYTDMPLPPERARYRKYLAWGADVVVAHHPHVIQNYERVGGKLIFYSLGNFIFDTPTQRQFPHTDRGVLLRLTFAPGEEIRWTCLATETDRQAQRVRAAGRPGEGTPPVFSDIGGLAYRLLWPLAAKGYREVSRKKQMLFPKEEPGGSRRPSLLRRAAMLRYREKRVLLYGRLGAALRIYALAGRPDVVRYLLGDGGGSAAGDQTGRR